MATRSSSRATPPPASTVGVGGHISTYASSAALYEVGFNHFFRGKDHPGGGDQVFIQGHASPGIYARAFLEGRIGTEQLDGFRQEHSHASLGGGLPSYPHPRLLPNFWEFPTVSMGLGPLQAIYQARFNRYLHNRGIKDTSQQHVDYINTIPPEQEPWFPGDEFTERRIRAYIRWNAAVMVSRANRPGLGVGGHIATYASAASLYEVGFYHFFRGKDHGESGDQVFIQGHAAPGIYARAFLEGRLTEDQLNGFRQELSHPGGGLPSYPHPRLMPEFWEFPTVSMGLTAINSIYQARFNRYLLSRKIKDTSRSHVWCFLGDGEMDEPESLGAIGLAAREELDNLTFVINCNLQQLDGPVRGDGKIIQELESFRSPWRPARSWTT